MKKFTHDEVIRRLRELQAAWPNDLWLFAGDSALSLMLKKDGRHAMTSGGVVDPTMVLASFPKIESDGGGF